MASNPQLPSVQIPPLRTNLNDPNGTNQTAKEWYYFWKTSGDRINMLDGMISYGTHADRPKPADAPDGALYFENDRSDVLYENQADGAWHYVAGTMWDTLSPDDRPTDLGPNDAGFTFRTTDLTPQYAGRTFVWTGTVWEETTAARFDTHANRISGGVYLENGALWVETDRSDVLYQLQGTVWQYIAGTMWNTLSPDMRPTDLGPHDAGFHYRGTDLNWEYIWSGTIWVESGVNLSVNGSLIATRPGVNLIAGSNATITGVDNPTSSRVDVTIAAAGGGNVNYSVNGSAVGTQPGLNLIAGTNVTLSGANNAAASRVDVTVAAAGGGTGGGAVSSVFGRTGAVLAATGDYNVNMITDAVSTLGMYADPAWITALSWAKLTGVPTLVNSFNTRTGAVVPASGDYAASQVTNAVDQTATYANPAWITSLAYSKLTGVPAAPVTSVFGRTGAVVQVSGDYTAAQVTNAVSTASTYSDPAWLTALSWSKLTGVPTLVNSFNARTGAVAPASGDYTAAQVTNAVSTASTYSDPAWLTALSWSKITGTPSISSYQTPWLSNINGGGFSLSNVTNVTTTSFIGVGTTSLDAMVTVKAPNIPDTIGSKVDLLNLYTTPSNGQDSHLRAYAYRSTAGTDWNGISHRLQHYVQTSAMSYMEFNAAPAGSQALVFGTASTGEILRIANTGNVGIVISNPTYLLQLGSDSAAKPSTSTWTISSGAKVKKDIKNLEGGLSVINKLRPTEAKYNGLHGTPKDQRVVSCVAEEVEKVLPGCVTHKEVDGQDVLGFNPHEVLFHLILAVQQLSKENTELKKLLKHP